MSRLNFRKNSIFADNFLKKLLIKDKDYNKNKIGVLKIDMPYKGKQQICFHIYILRFCGTIIASIRTFYQK
ncbi:protein of unknown function [Ruminococcaceae bacterium BL-4]|nr:protein of unknown function [Ruminococcaceae bacterium BL-4]